MVPPALVPIGTPEVFRNHRHGLNAIACDPSGARLATVDVDMALEIYREGKLESWFDIRSTDIKARNLQRTRALAFTADGSRLVAAAGERLLCIDPMEQRIEWAYTAPRTFAFLVTSPSDVALSADGKIGVAFDNGTLALFSASGTRLRSWRDDESPRHLRFLDSRTLIGTDSFRLLRWDAETGEKTLRLPLAARAYAMQTAPNDPLVALRTLDAVQLVDAHDAHLVASIPVGAGLPRLAFHPRERILAVADRHAVTETDFNGRFLRRWEVPEAAVLSLAYAADGNTLYVGGSDRQLRHFRRDVVEA